MSPWLAQYKGVSWISLRQILCQFFQVHRCRCINHFHRTLPFHFASSSGFNIAAAPNVFFNAITSQTETTIRFYVSCRKHQTELGILNSKDLRTQQGACQLFEKKPMCCINCKVKYTANMSLHPFSRGWGSGSILM